VANLRIIFTFSLQRYQVLSRIKPHSLHCAVCIVCLTLSVIVHASFNNLESSMPITTLHEHEELLCKVDTKTRDYHVTDAMFRRISIANCHSTIPILHTEAFCESIVKAARFVHLKAGFC
jgi:hypothetical protein